jgi:hypothetical protein
MRLDWRVNRPTKVIERNVSPFNIIQVQLFQKCTRSDEIEPIFCRGARQKRQKDCHVSQRRSRVSKRGKKSARFQMHNQRISFVFLFSSRQRRISSFLKKKAHTHYQDPANSFTFFPPHELCFPNFDDSLKFPSHLSCEALEKKVERPAGTSDDDDDSNDSRGLVGATNRAAHSAHIIRKHKTHTDVLNRSPLFLFSFFFFRFLFYFIFVAFFFGSVSPAVVCRW